MSPSGYDVLALLVIAALVYYGLKRYHDRRRRELELEHMELEGWRTYVLGMRAEFTQCPYDGTPLFNDAARVQHQHMLTSACAAFQEQARAKQESEELERIHADAEAAGRWNVSATVGGETFTNDAPAGELEGGKP